MKQKDYVPMVEYNYDHNYRFAKYCDSLGIMYRGFYGETTCSLADAKKVIAEWEKAGHVFYRSVWENDMSYEATPDGGWKNESEELVFLKAFRKMERSDKSTRACREFMRNWLGCPDWNFR